MKIGVITFHWATNYGAVLQAFALQKYLQQKGFDAEIIDYIPFKIKSRQLLSYIKHLKINNLIKEYRINKFKREKLFVSEKTYYESADLIHASYRYDKYICGSDQIWNEWFSFYGESGLNLSYYLDFVANGKDKISYAASFGTDSLSKTVFDLVKPELEKFKSISVRENTAAEILKSMGLCATVVIDPTLLLEKEFYENLIKDKIFKKKYDLFSYILHENQNQALLISDYVFQNYFDCNIEKKYKKEPIGIYEWLYNVRNTRFVVTNSFHGIVFSILFHKNFIAVPVENSKMNDRISTLLSALELEDRLISDFNTIKIDGIFNLKIQWESVDEKLKILREHSEDFLIRNLN